MGDISNVKQIELIKKISYRIMNLHKIYSFNLITFPSSSNLGNSIMTNLRKKKDIVDSRDLLGNILLRTESIMFFSQKMQSDVLLEGGEYNIIRHSQPFDYKTSRTHMIISRNYLFYFDCIINQIISLYEYIANCSCYILVGQQKRKTKWNNSLNEIKNKNYNELFHTMKRINDEFINYLSEIRADIFHYNFLKISSSYNHNFMSGLVEMKFQVDKKILTFLKRAKIIEHDCEGIEIRMAINMIMEKSFEYVIEILEDLKQSIFIYNVNCLKGVKPKTTKDIFNLSDFQNLLEFQESLLYHWAYFWDDVEQLEKLEYMQRQMGRMMLPFKFFPEE